CGGLCRRLRPLPHHRAVAEPRRAAGRGKGRQRKKTRRATPAARRARLRLPLVAPAPVAAALGHSLPGPQLWASAFAIANRGPVEDAVGRAYDAFVAFAAPGPNLDFAAEVALYLDGLESSRVARRNGGDPQAILIEQQGARRNVQGLHLAGQIDAHI